MNNFEKYKKIKIHFIGIGGIGMSGIAELMLDQGYYIQGSDININANIIRLKKRGAKIFIGHNKNNIKKINAAVFSSAIKTNNLEIIECKKLSIPLVSRADMLAELMRNKKSIAIAGSHGKTTTTSLVGTMLDHSNFDPTIVNGGIINSYSRNNRFGKGEWMVVEADESDGSFLRLPHEINIITNLDIEHLDYYKSEKNLINSFEKFINNLPFYGYSIVCLDSVNLRKIVNKIKTRKLITYSYKNIHSNIKITSIKRNKKNTEFIISIKKNIIKNIYGNFFFKTNLLGDHNILNATAAITASLIAGASIKKIQKALVDFQGVKRRFSYLGKIGNAYIYDDYAHHPTEIKASYQIARQIVKKKIIVIFQPHRYSRTKYLFKDFIKELSKISILYIMDIYPAGEKPIIKINSKNLVTRLQLQNKKVFYVHKNINFNIILKPYFKENNTIIFMGAGSVTYEAQKLINENNVKKH